MAQETARLARYAAALDVAALPPEVVRRAKHCIADTIAAVLRGAGQADNRGLLDYAVRTGPGGRSRILGSDAPPVQAPAAALANGALAHALELDSLTRPTAGVHPGATLLPPALAIAQERGLGGRALIQAVVAGCEVMYRIGVATHHSNEVRGFHAPGTTGPFGAAVAAGRLLGLDERGMTSALGIAGSLAGGLMQFARAGSGGMVKRLHLGRASESGVLAASLAAAGFTGPPDVIEGELGFLHVFCTEWDMAALTDGLGERFDTLKICLKAYPCHITAHTPVQAVRELVAAHGFAAGDIAAIVVEGAERMVTMNGNKTPGDLQAAQYSVPFSVALAMVRDPRDPASFDATALADPRIAALCRKVELRPAAGAGGRGNWASTVAVTLADGRRFERRCDAFKGMPELPLGEAELREKFLLVAGPRFAKTAPALFDRLMRLETEETLGWIGEPRVP